MNKLVDDCVFCKIISHEAPAQVLYNWGSTMAMVPLNPVVPGHLLIIPKIHVRDYKEDPSVTAEVMKTAAGVGALMGDSNLITSSGPAATQTVMHFHVHLVPRGEGDGLALPWTGQEIGHE